MLELTQAQLDQLQRLEHDDFVSRVRVEIVERFPELSSDEGLLLRMRAAHGHALCIGIEDAGQRTQFLYTEAFAPGFYEKPAVAAWLARPGASPAQRWKDFMALSNKPYFPQVGRRICA